MNISQLTGENQGSMTRRMAVARAYARVKFLSGINSGQGGGRQARGTLAKKNAKEKKREVVEYVNNVMSEFGIGRGINIAI